jgi:uncharacterized membrane protein YphA (DoxX/SURF4 family)
MLRLFYPALLITLMFFLSGIEKITTFTKTSMNFANKINIPLTLSKLVISVVIVLEIIAPLIIARYTYTGTIQLLPWFKTAVIALILFTVAATLIYHNPFESSKNYNTFISHLSLIGGLLALYMCA